MLSGYKKNINSGYLCIISIALKLRLNKLHRSEENMRVAAINDLSGFGKCSLLADIGVMSAMGIEVCPVPTAVLSAQTGFSSYYMQDLEGFVEHCKEEWIKMKAGFDGILTGYMPYEKVVDDVSSFADAFKKNGNILLVDPVMGDGGQCYSNYTDGMLSKIQKLASKAEIITPNLTELCLLAGLKADTDLSIDEIKEAALKVRYSNHQSIVVTGIHIKEDELCNLVVSPQGIELINCKTNGMSYSGTGDLFAASVMGNVLNGKNVIEAVAQTTEFISSAISVTKSKERNYGIDFERALANINRGEKT